MSTTKPGKSINGSFNLIAQKAVEAEIQGDYEAAADLWSAATRLAKKNVNIQWAEHRNQFCLSILRNGWSQRES